MKHSIRFVQFNYSQAGKGTTILVLRGMEVREYKYSSKRFDMFLDAREATKTQWERDYHNLQYTSFSRVYPE